MNQSFFKSFFASTLSYSLFFSSVVLLSSLLVKISAVFIKSARGCKTVTPFVKSSKLPLFSPFSSYYL